MSNATPESEFELAAIRAAIAIWNESFTGGKGQWTATRAALIAREHDDPKRAVHFLLDGETTVAQSLRLAVAEAEAKP